MAKFYARVMKAFRVTIPKSVREVEDIRVGDWVEVEVKPVKKEAEG